MIIIVDINQRIHDRLETTLKELSLEYKITCDELSIAKSDLVILWGRCEPAKMLKEIQMHNLFSMLRICKKPVLGIGTGALIMCNKFENEKFCGLGLINSNIEKLDNNFTGSFELEINNDYWNELKEDKFFFDTNYNMMGNSDAKVQNINAIIKNDKFTAVNFYPELSDGKKFFNTYLASIKL